MTRSKFNSKFRMSGLRSMIFILIFVALISAPVGYAVTTLAPDEFVSSSTSADSDNDENVDSESEQQENTDNEDFVEENIITDDEETDKELGFEKHSKKGLMPGVSEGSFDDIDEGKFVYVVNKNMSLQDSTSEANIMIYNPKENSFNLSLKIEVSGKTIYQTGIIKPNHYIENDFFDVELSKGEYDGDIEVIAYDTETNEKQEVYTDTIKITVTE